MKRTTIFSSTLLVWLLIESEVELAVAESVIPRWLSEVINQKRVLKSVRMKYSPDDGGVY